MAVGESVGEGGGDGVWAFTPVAPTAKSKNSKILPGRPARIGKFGLRLLPGNGSGFVFVSAGGPFLFAVVVGIHRAWDGEALKFPIAPVAQKVVTTN